MKETYSQDYWTTNKVEPSGQIGEAKQVHGLPEHIREHQLEDSRTFTNVK